MDDKERAIGLALANMLFSPEGLAAIIPMIEKSLESQGYEIRRKENPADQMND